MHPENVTYKDLVALIKEMKNCNSFSQPHSSEPDQQPNLSNLIYLKNQFFWIVKFPDFLLDFVSPSIHDVLGFSSVKITLKFILGLIHKEDTPVVLLALKKVSEAIDKNYNHMTPLNTVFSMDFRLKKENGSFIRVLSQSCLLSHGGVNTWFKVLSLNTDISEFKTSNKIQFGCYSNEAISLDFPDTELTRFSNIFTPRECEIIRLLAKGKNSYEIGLILNISRHTVDTHRRNMLAKSHLCNTAELIAFSNEKCLL